MPSKNVLKKYLENGYYHIYNRGVEKRKIFQDEQDYSVFLSYLKTYLTPKDEEQLRSVLLSTSSNCSEKERASSLLKLNNFYDEAILLAFSLLSNHFHFLIKQKLLNSIDRFMRSLCTRYTMYFNTKYRRVGPLYQTAYKAVNIESDQQLLYISSYIHRNLLPEKLSKTVSLSSLLYSQPSSLPEYLGLRKTEWVHPEEILSFFSKTNPNLSYLSFVEQTDDFSLIKDSLVDL